MADVPRVLLDHVDQETPQAGCLTEVVGDPRGQPIQAAVGQRLRDQGAGHGGPPEREELLGGVLGGRVPVALGVGLPVRRVPRGPRLSAEQLPGETVVLDLGQVLEEPAKGDRRGGEPRVKAGRVQFPALLRQGRALALQGAQEGGGLVAREGRFRAPLLVHVGHGR